MFYTQDLRPAGSSRTRPRPRTGSQAQDQTQKKNNGPSVSLLLLCLCVGGTGRKSLPPETIASPGSETQHQRPDYATIDGPNQPYGGNPFMLYDPHEYATYGAP